ncbi:MAG: DUF370 domain-containing protein [Clostridia bacterium]|nr:DUF370 domain-containing protein [Clostridia bacterium]
MFLHVGNGKSIRKNRIIGIFDLDTATVSSITKNYINKKQKEGLLEYDDTDLPRSFVVYDDKDGVRISLSRISTSGLKLRALEKITEINND